MHRSALAAVVLVACSSAAPPVPRYDAGPRPDAGRVDAARADATGIEAEDGIECVGARSSFAVMGDAVDWVSGGRAYAADPSASWRATLGSEGALHFVARASDASEWSFTFRGPHPSALLAEGRYDRAQRASEPADGRPGLDVHSDARGCNDLTGTFTVHEVEVVDVEIRTFRASFEQHCEGEPNHAIGCVHFVAP